VYAVSLNYRDANTIHNTNPWPVLSNGIPCSDCAGRVTAVGENITRFVVEDRVSPIFDQLAVTNWEQNKEWLGGEVDRVLATHVVFDQEKCVRVPAGLGLGRGSALTMRRRHGPEWAWPG
jgi:NADPH:quinone reductase-like Zn-dependent oxidoreductase